ncbi:MAG: HD domain-containing protein [Nitrososphaera sp.]|nr:HD domain-containing protein [Nitrososphaera sp.]
MIRKALLLKIFDAAYMQRWNDRIRPVELIELDKQAHKMVIAYFLGKFAGQEKGFSWIKIIEGGLFELLQRIVITDLKPPIFYKIREQPTHYRKLNDWVFTQLQPFLSPLGDEFLQRFRQYFANIEDTLNKRILAAAHLYATKWEFEILRRADPNAYEVREIDERLARQNEKYYDLQGIQELVANEKHARFIHLCGQLRFQSRWANIHRIPKTSVIGHTLLVAILSYLFSLELAACERRCVNNYFTGLFHDMPEVLTRDIISPVKRSIEGLSGLIKEYERKEMEREVYGLIPSDWHSEIGMFTRDEFANTVTVNGKVRKLKEAIPEKYNKNKFNPRDGQLVKAADDLGAFIEAYAAIQNGCPNQSLQEARLRIRNSYKDTKIGCLNFGEIYSDFD